MKNCFLFGDPNIPGKKYYSYHGVIRDCPIQPDPGNFLCEDLSVGPFPIYEKLLKITTLYQCGEVGWPTNLYAPLGYKTCDPGFVVNDDVLYLYTKTEFGSGNGQALYNKESFLDKLTHKVVAIQGVEVHMKGEVIVNVPGDHPICGINKGRLFVACMYTENSWQSICLSPGSIYELSYEWKKCKPLYANARNWDMEYLEDYAKIGFRVDQCLEVDPGDWGRNKTRCYHNYCVVKYKKTLVVTRGFEDLEWDIGPTWVWLYGTVLGGGNGYFISGFEYWERDIPLVKYEKTSKGPFSTDERDIWQYITGLKPATIYGYRALLRNTGSPGDTIFGISKGFTTKNS